MKGSKVRNKAKQSNKIKYNEMRCNIMYESLCLGPCDDNKDCIPFGYSFDIELARSSEGARCLLLPWENIAVIKLPLSLFVFWLLSFD